MPRSLKAGGAEKSALAPVIAELVALKADFERATGAPFDPPKKTKAKTKSPQDANKGEQKVRCCFNYCSCRYRVPSVDGNASVSRFDLPKKARKKSPQDGNEENPKFRCCLIYNSRKYATVIRTSLFAKKREL